MEREGDEHTNCNWYGLNDPKGLVRVLEELEIGRRAENIPTSAW